jgi:hypothetical protein
MNRDCLAELIRQPEVQREIFRGYEGSYYSIGLLRNPENRGEFAIRVRIEGEDDSSIPPQITLDGHAIPIITATHYKLPRPLSA